MSVFPIFISLPIEKYETISAQTKENLSFFVFLSNMHASTQKPRRITE